MALEDEGPGVLAKGTPFESWAFDGKSQPDVVLRAVLGATVIDTRCEAKASAPTPGAGRVTAKLVCDLLPEGVVLGLGSTLDVEIIDGIPLESTPPTKLPELLDPLLGYPTGIAADVLPGTGVVHLRLD